MDIMERAAYLHGLADGLDMDTDSKEGKLLLAMIEVIDELAASVNDLQEANDGINDELDEIAEQLIEIEDALDEDDVCDCDCADELDGFYYEVECPTCGERVTVDEDILEMGKIKCPSCDEDLEFEFDEDECDDPCCECNS